jgi:hypothetical protein
MIKKKSRTIPFGYKSNSSGEYLEPIQSELEALDQAKNYLKTCSLRETSEWLHRKTGRYISHVGLKKRIDRGSPSEAKDERGQAESKELSQTDFSTDTN